MVNKNSDGSFCLNVIWDQNVNFSIVVGSKCFCTVNWKLGPSPMCQSRRTAHFLDRRVDEVGEGTASGLSLCRLFPLLRWNYCILSQHFSVFLLLAFPQVFLGGFPSSFSPPQWDFNAAYILCIFLYCVYMCFIKKKKKRLSFFASSPN